MSEISILSNLRHYRAQVGLSQGDLATRAGLSRQAVVAIEGGRQVPSTTVALRLARILDCSVEDLFALPINQPLSARLAPDNVSTSNRRREHNPAPDRAPSQAAANETPVRLALGRIDRSWVAHPLERSDQPCDALLLDQQDTAIFSNDGDANREASGPVMPSHVTRTPRGAREGLSEPSSKPAMARVEPLSNLTELENNVLVAGCAPLLGLLTGLLGRQNGESRATWISANSTRAINLLARDFVHVAGVHLVETTQPQGHAQLVSESFPGRTTTIMNLTCWRQGLVVPPGNPLGLRGASDLLRPGLRLARRDAGSGAHALLVRLLEAEGASPAPPFTGPMASSHAEVARWVQLGFADAGIAIEATALALDLDFIPLAEERFDLVVPQQRLTDRPVTRLLELIDKPTFKNDARRIGGYNLSTAGHVSTVRPS